MPLSSRAARKARDAKRRRTPVRASGKARSRASSPKKRRPVRARSSKTSLRQFRAESDAYVARVPAAKRKARAAQSRATSAAKKKSFVAKNVQVGSDSRSKQRASGFTTYANPPKKKGSSRAPSSARRRLKKQMIGATPRQSPSRQSAVAKQIRTTKRKPSQRQAVRRTLKRPNVSKQTRW